MNTKKIIKAVIFDMDGVISDTEMLHSGAKSDILSKIGIKMSAPEITKKYAGMNSKSTFEAIFRDLGKADINLDIDKFVKDYWQMVRTNLTGDIKEVEGTREFIDRLLKSGLPLAVASGALAEFIDLILSKLGLKDKFSALASTYEVKNGKPAPDVFLLAAKKLGVAPEFCLVVEDAMNGMLAAKQAGMSCVGLVREDDGREYPADLIVNNLMDEKISQTFDFQRI